MLGDFTYENPCRLHFGPNALDQLPGELAGYGPRSSWPTAAAPSSAAACTRR
ncbi:hypothetical protein [Parafannyhessea umbonata]|uniref:hypothetical protein n=1 Tax=Parafannyhessea umbonata TaxID=604330 RepID=UPI0026EFEAAC|nr:hypothetical protein [Parafannyhessea umbonata]MDD7198898.1 hypothetical protein [Parafannyhessea umbonata]MDY4418660.1 hypothetical protein [Parafannyhessea umbonata]